MIGIFRLWLGMTFLVLGRWFILLWSYPYGDVSSEEVERLYGVQRFPDVDSLYWGDVVMSCWCREGRFGSGCV